MVRSLKNSKRGAYFFVIDALIGILIFATTVFVIAGFNTVTPSSDAVTQQMDLLTEDLFATELRFVDITADYFFKMKVNPLYDPFYTVDEFVYQMNRSGDTGDISILLGNLTAWLVPTYGINYTIIEPSGNEYELFSRPSTISTYAESRSSLTREKVTLVGSNITHYVEPVFTKLVIWR